MRIFKTVALAGATLCSFASAFAAEKKEDVYVIESKLIRVALNCAHKYSLEEGNASNTGDFRLQTVIKDGKLSYTSVEFFQTEKIRQVATELYACRGMEVPQELAKP